MNKIRCFWIEPTDQVLQSLRRFTYGSKRECPGRSGHDASVDIDQCAVSECPRLYEGQPVHGDMWTHSDPRWPKHCAHCGYEFAEDDDWQYNPNILYRRVDTGELMTDRQAPAGAMRHAGWMECFAIHKGSALILECKLPDGVWWCVDGPATNGTPENPGWTRVGIVPDITARPSIATPGYHGFLTDGYLDEC